VFNNTTHHGSSRAAHYNRSLPEVPNYEEIEKFMKDSKFSQLSFYFIISLI